MLSIHPDDLYSMIITHFMKVREVNEMNMIPLAYCYCHNENPASISAQKPQGKTKKSVMIIKVLQNLQCHQSWFQDTIPKLTFYIRLRDDLRERRVSLSRLFSGPSLSYDAS